MPFTAGVFTSLYNWLNEANAGNPIDPTKFTAEEADIATGLSNCILKDGTQTVTADIPLNSHKLTGVATPTNAADAATKGYVDGLFSTGTSTITFTGMSSTTSGTAVYCKAGNIAALYIPLINGTSNLVTFTATGMPAAIRPAQANFNLACTGLVDNNVSIATTTASQYAQIDNATGTITFFKGGLSNGWTNSGTKGTNGTILVYPLN